ncbi:helix-turn-helix domain-containing protein [Umezakia ovalisporum]|uniref:helix-turn-helix domain-containing protein n=1 Tax=Umezakia ovalisporum TaxID=75695 RepID=UPI0039C6361B
MNKNEGNEKEQTGFFMIPVERLTRIELLLNEIKSDLQSKTGKESARLDYIDEKEAMKLFGRKATWFWSLRKEGKIKFTKIGSKVFYPVAELQRLLNNG